VRIRQYANAAPTVDIDQRETVEMSTADVFDIEGIDLGQILSSVTT
jgi:hypothetical protein